MTVPLHSPSISGPARQSGWGRFSDGDAMSIVKHRQTGTLYEIDYVVHSTRADGKDVYACHKLSAYDGMPIGPLVYLPCEAVLLGRRPAPGTEE